MAKQSPALWRVVLAWGVHLYTGLGLLLAAWIAVCLVNPQPDFRTAFILMLVATLVDATDGTLARAIRIKEVLPKFDGRRLDDLIDFLTYACLPLFLIWRARVLPDGWDAVLLLPLLASAYGFCQVSIKTDDGFFLGFPSCWNFVAFYIYALQPMPEWISLAILVVLSVLTFVPLRYLYPSQRGRLNVVTNILAAAWVVLVVWILIDLPNTPGEGSRSLVLLSLYFPIFYLGASWAASLVLWRRRKRTQPTLATKS